MSPYFSLTHFKRFSSYLKVAWRPRTLVLATVGVSLLMFALVSGRRASAVNGTFSVEPNQAHAFSAPSAFTIFSPSPSATNRNTINATFRETIRSHLPGLLGRYLAPTPTFGTCDTASAIEVEASAGTVGPTGYTTLRSAFAAINSGTHQGAITIDVCGTTNEAAQTALLNASGSGSASYTSIAISPAGGAARTISGNTTNGNPLIDLNGADNVTINGLNTGGNSLTISNTTNSGTAGTSTIRFINDATSNTIQNCTILGSETSTTSGVVFFSTTTGTTGNDGNTITGNNIGPAGTNLPTNGVFSNGSIGTAAQNNSGNTISNNNIFNFFSAAAADWGILVSTGNTDWTITGNSLYQTATRTMTTAATDGGIQINNTSGNNFVVSNNFIGGSTSSAGGTAWTIAGSIANRFRAISLNVGATTASSVQGNTITNFNFTSNSNATTVGGPWTGIYLGAGNANIGTTTGNTIGSGTGNGSITISIVTNSGSISSGIFCDSASTASSISNNTIGSVSFGASGIGQGFQGIATTAGTTLTISGNTVGSTTTANSINVNTGYTGATTQIVRGINNTSSATIGITGNTVANINNNYLPAAPNGANVLVGITSTAGVNTVSGNTVRNLSTAANANGTNATAGLIGVSIASATAGQSVSQNTIHTLSDSHASGAVNVVGLFYSGPTTGTNLIARNSIHSFSTASTTAVQQGINANGTGIGTFQNNMVRLGIDATGTSITSSAAITGILKATSGNNNFYFNSVFIGGSSVVGGTVNTFGFRRTGTATDDFRDNIFVNSRSNTSGTAKHFAFVLSATTTITSDYNIYLANGTGGVLASVNDGTTSLATLAALQAATSQDAHSQSADPLFVNSGGTSSTVDLHIQSGFATPVEGVGVDIPSVADDFDGQTRSTLTPVDIGADAGAFVSADVNPPVITYTPFAPTTNSISNRVLTATIVDATGVPTTGSFVPRIYYKKNSDAYFSQPGSLTSGNGQNGSWSFTIVVADMGGVGGGDTISYFVIAQDRVGNLVSNPAGAVASDVNTVTTPPASPNTYTIPGISGTFNVGVGGDYTTLTAAVAAYNAAVQNGPVTFTLTDSTYPSETFPITINANAGSSATNILTVVPASGVSPTISAASGGIGTSILKFNGADYVVIDGSNNGSSTRNLTISNTDLNPSTAVIWLSSAGTGAGATHNIIKNCNLSAGADETANTTATFGILSSGTSIGATNDGLDNDNNTFTNNAIIKARYGIFVRGSLANTNDGNVISNNLIGPAAFGANEIGTDGIVIQHQNLATVMQNEVRFVGGDFANRNAGSTLKAIGIGIGSETWTPTATVVTNSTVTRNLIHDIVDEQTGSAVGIVVAGTGNPVSNPTTNIVANNMLYNLHSNATGSNQTLGIGIAAGKGDAVVFNTISLTGDLDPPATTTAANSAVGIRIASTTPANLTLKDNIISADVSSNTAALHHYAIVAPSSSYAWGTGSANNNDYYVNITNPQMVFGALGTGTTYTNEITSLSAWRTTFTPSQDAASQNVNPPFVSATDLHLSTSTATTLESGGTPISGVTDDFDGDTRNASLPDIGADEGAFVPGYANDVAAAAFIDPANGGSKQATVAFAPQASFSNVGTASQTNVPVRYRIFDSGNNEVYNQTATIASLPFGTTATVTFPNATIASGGSYTIRATAELPGDGNAADDEIVGSLTVVIPITGSHTVGNGQDYNTLTDALADLNVRGVASPATLLLTSTYDSTSETFPIAINPVTGASSTNTLTIKPAPGVSPTISASTSCVLKLNGADYIVVDGSNTNGGTTRDLTITNTHNATNTAAICLVSLGAGAGATNNTIKNTNISTGVDQTTNPDNISFAILSGGANITTTSDGPDNDSNTFANNFITKARYGIYLRGKALNSNDNNVISGNLIGPTAFGASEIGVAGVTLQYQNSANVTQNEVRFVGALFADSGFDNTRVGIAIGGVGLSPWQPASPTAVTNSSITRNLIHDIVDEHEFSAVGIILAGPGVPSSNVVANNMLYGIRSNGTSGDQALGIGIASGGSDKVVFNTISLTGDMDPAGTVAATGSAAAVRIDSAAVTDLTLKDNILAADVSSNTPSLKHYTIEAPSSSYAWGSGGENYNDFYFNGSNSQMALGGLGTPSGDAVFSTVSTLSSWQGTFTPAQDANSISANPLFTSTTNLHIDPATAHSSPVSNVGTTITGVTDDFDGNARDASTPDIGADEFVVDVTFNSSGNLPAGTYNNIIVNGGAVATQTGSVTVNGCVTVNSGGTLNMGTFIISGPGCFTLSAGGTLGIGHSAGITTSGASGNIQVAGTRTFDSGANYIYNGSGSQVTGNGLPGSVNNLDIENAAGVTLSQAVTVNGILTLNGDLMTTDSFVLTENGTSAGTADVVGTVQRSDVAAGPVAFGNPNVRVTNGNAMTLQLLLVKSAPASFSAAVNRTYTLNIVSGSVSSATIRFHYLDAELNSNNPSLLHLWRADGDPTATWLDQGATNSQTGSDPNNWVELAGPSGFSSWTIAGAPAVPTAVKLSRFGAESYGNGVAINWESGFEVDNLGYHLYRERNGIRSRVTPALVAGSALKVGPSSKLTAGYAYSWFDSEGTADTAYYLESIDLHGERVLTGPIYPASGDRPATGKRAALLSEVNADADNSPANRFEQTWPTSMGASPNVKLNQQMAYKPAAAATASAASVTQQAIANSPAVKISVSRTGWYRVTQPELIAGGLDPNSDPRRLQLFVDGQEIPIIVNGGNGSRLETSDSIEFYGQALDTINTDTHIYWLVNGTSPGKRINRPKPLTKPNGQDWTSLLGGSFNLTVERRDKVIYFSSLLNGEADNILGPVISSFGATTQDLTITNLDANAPQAQLSVTLQGATDVDHQVQVQLNGMPVGTVNFNGRQHPTQSFPVDRSLLREGTNVLTLTAAASDLDISLVDAVSLSYAHRYRADSNALRFSVAAGQTVIVNGFSSAALRVIDISNAAAPTEVAVPIAMVDGSYGFKLQANSNTGPRTFMAFADELAAHPSAVIANQPASLTTMAAADMLIVTYRDFRAAVEPLAAQRRSEGLTVAIVDIEDIYDEFSFGAHSPYALRDFLAWTNSHWTHAPRYLLLVGDSSWDPRNYLQQGFADFVPTKLIDTVHMETASDDWLADFDGDGVADIATGRLPARTAADATLMVDKILAYERERQAGTALRGALMVADSGFESESSATAALLPSTMAVDSINRAQIGSDDLTRTRIVNDLNQGPLIANYFGHGSVTVWTGAGLLNSSLATSLTNSNQPTLFVLMTCLNGYSHDAYVDSLAESLLKAQNGGAMAVWASSGFTESDPQFVLSSEFYRQLFRAPQVRLGDTFKPAKATISDSDVRRTWLLLGDPSMRLR
jgi:hypothetical protein